MNDNETNPIENAESEDSAAPPEPKKRRGLVIVYTGDGKGKTTAALGLAFRALGSGLKIFMVQFIKGKWKTGEKKFADRLFPEIEIRPMGDGFTWDTKNPAQDIATTLKIWETGKEAILSGKYDMVILDEINVVMKLGYLDPAPVVELLKARDPRLHVVLTGRGAPAAIVETADLVSEVVPIKHPYKLGIKAQRGIEF
jgi:cob(I)alamin adenosyltransferase